MNQDELKQFMVSQNLTSAGLAEILGVSTEAVNLWLNGSRKISETNKRILKLFAKKPDLMEEF